ncbi:MAG: hypothetical protein OXF88_08915, partial [Rhodobacteraceae bacterium]|nr:hypothetical protein [Paracoccaceae bacterium]
MPLDCDWTGRRIGAGETLAPATARMSTAGSGPVARTSLSPAMHPYLVTERSQPIAIAHRGFSAR